MSMRVPHWTSPRVSIPVFETSNECAGAAASYVLRQIAFRAGAYAPGIQEALFEELHTADNGETIADIAQWFARRGRALVGLGYRLQCRPTSMSTNELVAWIRSGRGHRGAVLMVNPRLLDPRSTATTTHTVGLSIEHSAPDAEGELAMTDASRSDATRLPVPATLAAAHRDRDCLALVLHWVGWS
jgi:hypothetical protein